MSTTFIITLIAAGLAIMVAVAWTLQLVEKHSREKRRALAALKTRARDLQYMLDQLPEGFLSPALQSILVLELLSARRRLQRLEPGIDHASAAATLEAQLKTLQSGEQAPVAPGQLRLNDRSVCMQTQKLLQQLFSLVDQARRGGRLPSQEAEALQLEIRQLNAACAAEALTIDAAEAAAGSKLRLARHNYEMARDTLSRDNDSGQFSVQIEALEAKIEQLRAQLGEAEDRATQARAEAEEEWKNFQNEDESWKKKKLYD